MAVVWLKSSRQVDSEAPGSDETLPRAKLGKGRYRFRAQRGPFAMERVSHGTQRQAVFATRPIAGGRSAGIFRLSSYLAEGVGGVL